MQKLIVVFEIDPSWEQEIIQGIENTFGNTNAKYTFFEEIDFINR